MKTKYTGRELLWIIVSAGTLLAAFYVTFRDGIARAYPLYILAGVAFLMFYLRFRLRNSKNR
ncbi:MAG: hypothetical protein CSB01_00300 [Bacteroidia bacterium]|nr:MAG: hypothetical protein CSB01_00300 [Bacteroidia bacterium]